MGGLIRTQYFCTHTHTHTQGTVRDSSMGRAAGDSHIVAPHRRGPAQRGGDDIALSIHPIHGHGVLGRYSNVK